MPRMLKIRMWLLYGAVFLLTQSSISLCFEHNTAAVIMAAGSTGLFIGSLLLGMWDK